MTENGKPFFRVENGGISIFIQVIPHSKLTTLEGLVADENEQYYLKMRVQAPAEKGKANKQVIKELAKWLEAPPSSLALLSGETARKKRLFIHSDDTARLIEKCALLCR